MAPNTDTNIVQVSARPATTDTDSEDPPRNQLDLFTLRWAVGEKWWNRSRSVAPVVCRFENAELALVTLARSSSMQLHSSFLRSTARLLRFGSRISTRPWL